MALVKIADLYPNYQESVFDGYDIKNFSVYDQTEEKIGSVYDLIVDESGKFRYLVIDTGFWIFGKKVLVPVGRVNVDYDKKRVYAQGFTKKQAEDLPEYSDEMTIDYDYEEKVRMIYRGVEYDNNDTVYLQESGEYDSGAYNQQSNVYDYDREPNLYAHQETDNGQSLKLYEERLVANKERFLAGTVSIGKKVATETASVSVPVEKERVVIERNAPTNTKAVTPEKTAFSGGEVARVEVFEESANIEKQAFVREEVSVQKNVERDVVSARETIRHEELDIETDEEAVIK
ncbi:conserved domain protein [Xenococcus sp. PCC 7305]|uniref:DUF2382 domain-containing protein n=1 Tax=Xenococcus sp. PCC 7305 TaxID=102125 RepID=UPI0002AC0800|nr:DUF2382 domain-containing protein [Xenococcus sp. PCC 7305]ELS04249.1 conserved domain protein [Xenococcus sp. PCC 7305]